MENRKHYPLATGVLDYFPDALMEVARVSLAGNKQHKLGPLHWDKSKSADEADALMRHLKDRGKRDDDGERHSAKVAWRALALLQRELDAERVGQNGLKVIPVTRVTQHPIQATYTQHMAPCPDATSDHHGS